MEKPPEQVQQQLAAAAVDIDEEKAKAALRKRYLLRCCSCAGASLFFLCIFTVALAFTVFRARAPEFRLNGSTVKLDLINGTGLPRPGSNATILADVSVKNRNFASFRHRSSAAPIYYRGAAIGEARAPPGNLPARRTERMNVTVDVIMDRVVALPGFGSDVESGSVTMSWCARVGGKAKFLIVKKHVTMKMNCTVTVDVAKMAILEYKCKQKIKLFN
ncbi:late embryogenesis abundant protein At1g64065-like [Salvia miltiorrhiza]|uniref:late embryogenesis abundant protein At1g64065-like n=1 Tax=Salvia miltiorrhiza TaxID=226208 RepID=UPI0025ABB5AB|nr:late embryogenesis abundant protein At1g64065-like [Salvia miltiorrhiza]